MTNAITESATPRTNVAVVKARQNNGDMWAIEIADFARQLERELEAVRAERDELKLAQREITTWKQTSDTFQREVEELRRDNEVLQKRVAEYQPYADKAAHFVVEAKQSDCIRRIHGYVMDRLEEVTNQIGGVIGYKLNLSAEETERLWRDIESGVKEPSLNPPAHESSMHADSEIKRFCDGPP